MVTSLGKFEAYF